MQNTTFTLAPEFVHDCFHIAELPLSELMLFDNANFPSLILIPRIANVSELFDLSEILRYELMDEICLTSQLLKSLFSCDKINVAAIGNKVAQLHIHIVARFKTDVVWPNPVWGLPTKPYTEQAAKEFVAKAQKRLPDFLPKKN